VIIVDGYVPSVRKLDKGSRAAPLYQGQIRSWVASRRWRVGRMLDESTLEYALERVESGESDGLIVVRFSHLGCSLEDALAAIERIQAAGGRFATVADGIDLDTPNGRLLLRLLLSVVDQNQVTEPAIDLTGGAAFEETCGAARQCTSSTASTSARRSTAK
jgi:hypothetical protein